MGHPFIWLHLMKKIFMKIGWYLRVATGCQIFT